MIFSDASALAAAAAEEFCLAAENSPGPFRVALSGGATPRALYALLADEKAPYRTRVRWDRVHFFWSDERCVPPDHADSNFRAASEALLARVPISSGNVHRALGELADADEAARLYEAAIRSDFAEAEGLPRFDLIFLGMGADGHTASLFPGSAVVAEKQKLAAAVEVEAKPGRRITLTLPILNAAAKVVFLVAGADKAETVRQVLEGVPSAARPAGLVRPTGGELLWLLDGAAAARLAH